MRAGHVRGLLAALGLIVGLAGVSHATPTRAQEAMEAFRSDADLLEFLMEDGELDLGEFGRIHFIDWDQTRARKRTVQVMLIGE